ncbi:helix-turn-helix domain-containing protein [Campylobacter hyointestinalis]|uniref:helix-turn-helix domain-containing protein n=1 Tax=Campylobacter hyointestinalis TaxID=198 RepID=UPI0007259C91|nr:helix-turn-helix transcriptional regulator [Campylobacter hyointestinalis]CUU79057.1 transcriptional repressor DicA [Campylobacter hyointestinalis subsp. hyointestinalis]
MINEEIKKLRKSLNLSQEDFGSILGVAQRTVSAWEAGNNEPSISILIFKKWGIRNRHFI